MAKKKKSRRSKTAQDDKVVRFFLGVLNDTISTLLAELIANLLGL